jgi:hypothetical protein
LEVFDLLVDLIDVDPLGANLLEVFLVEHVMAL